MLPQQRSTATFPGRHVFLLRHAARRLQGREDLRILSFGCSEGYECLDIADAFPQAAVLGCDVDEKALAAASERCAGRATIFRSTDADLAGHAPFDLVTAFNVLCRHPESSGRFDIARIYPFAEFVAGLEALDRVLAPGGLLALFNSPYFIEDVPAMAGYTAEPDCLVANNGWNEKFTPDGRRATRVVANANGHLLSRDELFGHVALGAVPGVTGTADDTRMWWHHAAPCLIWQQWLPGKERGTSLTDVFWRKPG